MKRAKNEKNNSLPRKRSWKKALELTDASQRTKAVPEGMYDEATTRRSGGESGGRRRVELECMAATAWRLSGGS